MASFTGVCFPTMPWLELTPGIVPGDATTRPQPKAWIEGVGCLGTGGAVLEAGEQNPARFRKKFSGSCDGGIGDVFFDKIYVLPRSIDAGIIISDQVYNIDIYSSYRTQTVNWTAYSDVALGVGADISTPVPPASIPFPPQSGAQRVLTLDDIGPPKIDGDIIFTFDVGGATIPVTGSRSQLLPYEPENDLTEDLLFLTNILEGRSGLEQRVALRAQPRSVLKYQVLVDDIDMQKLENQLFDGQNRAFGLPRWHEATQSTAAVIPTDTTISIHTTDYADFRADGLAVMWVDAFNFEVLQIATVNPTTLVFNSPFQSSFPAGTRVMPVSTVILGKGIQSSRHRQGLTAMDFIGTVLDNSADHADTSAYSTYNSKVFLDDTNFLLAELLNESFTAQRRQLDNRTGSPEIFSDQAVSRRTSSKGFITVDRQSAWQVRQLLHALKGKQTSFYMPSFKNDFVATGSVTSAGTSVDVTDVQYSTLVQQRQPRDIIRIVLKDGTVSDPKVVTGSTIPTPGTDRISISPDTWGVDAAPADIERIEYVHKVRLDSDKISMRFRHSNGNMRVGIQTKEVLD